MAHSICEVHIHMVFSTKDRQASLMREWRSDLYAVIGQIIKNHKGRPIKINGTQDHVHILFILPKEMDIAALARSIKANSSRWVHQHHHDKFAWQEGYAAFSVSVSNIPNVKSYIENQEKHHSQCGFEDELRSILKAAGLDPAEQMI